jgi:hypothetical protein
MQTFRSHRSRARSSAAVICPPSASGAPETDLSFGSQQKIGFTIKEAVHASGLSRSTLYVAIGKGVLRARKCGARTLILDADLRRFLRSLPQFSKAELRAAA